MERNDDMVSPSSLGIKAEDDIAISTTASPSHFSGRRPWQSPDMEIVLVSVTASGRGAQCEGSVFTNTS